MINIGSIIPNTILLMCGTINDENDIHKIKYVIANNLKILKNIKHKILVLNSVHSTNDLKNYLSELNKEFGLITLTDHINRRYQIGFIDSDLIGLNYIKSNNLEYDYILKLNIDILLFDELLTLKFSETSELIFFPEISCLEPSLKNESKYKLYKEKSMSELGVDKPNFGCWHQPWLYILHKNVEHLYTDEDISSLNECYYKWTVGVNGDLSNWRKQNEILCSEDMLINCIIKYKYKKYCLIRDESFDTYCKTVLNFKIGDATIKNFYIKNCGFCHWHSKHNKVIEISI